jgi:hypothetical protein
MNHSIVENYVDREFAPVQVRPKSVNAEPFASLHLSLEVLEHLLQEARSMQARFPFIVIEPSWAVSSMIKERPALLLAAVTNASSRYPRLQKSLATALQETFAHRVVIAGDQDLDLLQGMLLHLAWYALAIPKSTSFSPYSGFISTGYHEISSYTPYYKWPSLYSSIWAWISRPTCCLSNEASYYCIIHHLDRRGRTQQRHLG